MSQASVFISGTGLYTPEESISNEELVTAFNQYVENYNNANAAEIAAGDVEGLQPSSAAFIEKASGIKQRYVLNKAGILDPERMCPILPERSNEEPSIQCEMSVKAAREALANAGKTADDIDAVIVACSNMQRPYPAVSVEIQAALGIQGYGYDMNVACSSATFGVQAAADAVRSGSARAVLVLNPEICTGHLNFRDRDSHFIFGDACTAMVVESGDTLTSNNAYKILGTRLQTAYSNNIRNNFGFLNRGDESGIGQADKLFVQNGRKVFKEVVPMVAKQITEHLGALDIDPSTVKRLWLHQANLSMNQLVCKKVTGSEVNDDIAPVILDRYANTSSAGSVIAFHMYQQGFESGDQGVLCSFGAGYSIGSVILEKV
jgi:beta-ketodecanoyl-[acyl-carrier-protein] synthase